MPFDPFLRTLPAGPGPRLVGAGAERRGSSRCSAWCRSCCIGWLLHGGHRDPAQALGGDRHGARGGRAVPAARLAVGYGCGSRRRWPWCRRPCSRWRSRAGCSCRPRLFPGWLDAISQATAHPRRPRPAGPGRHRRTRPTPSRSLVLARLDVAVRRAGGAGLPPRRGPPLPLTLVVRDRCDYAPGLAATIRPQPRGVTARGAGAASCRPPGPSEPPSRRPRSSG